MSEESHVAKQIFLNAIDKYDPADWPVFLDGACGGDVELRREVERMLAAHQEQDSLFDIPPTEDAGKVDQPTGEMIGPYKLLQKSR